MPETITIRTGKIEKELMIAERYLDGMKTHFDLKRVPPCPLKGTDFDKLVHAACAAVRSARDTLRNDMGHKQPTLTTRGGPANRHGLWECKPQAALDWKCPACNWTLYARCWKCGIKIDTESLDGYGQELVNGVWAFVCDQHPRYGS